MTAVAAPHKLKREMSGFGGLVITLSGLSPSIGVYLAGSDIIHGAGSWVIPACCLAVLLGLVVSGVYAELGSAFPHAGGDYTLIGKTLGPTMAIATLVGSLTGLPIALALSGLGVAEYLRVVWPGLGALPVALACVAAVTVLAALSIRMNAWVTGLFLVIEVLSLAVTAWLGLAHPHRDLLMVAVHPMMAGVRGGLVSVPLVMMGVAGAGAVYAFNGYGSAVSFGEEVVGARSKMAWMIFGALGLAALTILPPLASVIVGARDLAEISAAPSPVSAFIREAASPGIAAAVSLGVAIAIFNAMIATALIGGRTLYACSRDQLWHPAANRAFASVHPGFGSPWVATLVLGAGGLALCTVPIATLIMINGNGAAINYALLAVGVILGRRSGSTRETRSRMPWHPVGPIVVILAVLGIVVAELYDTGSGRTGLLVTALFLGAGALYYNLIARRRGAWAHVDPDEEA
jgi:amino acid transporter